MKTYTLAEIKRADKKAKGYFFEKGNPPVVSKVGNFLITRGYGGGFVLYEFNPNRKYPIYYIKNSTSKEALKEEAKSRGK